MRGEEIHIVLAESALQVRRLKYGMTICLEPQQEQTENDDTASALKLNSTALPTTTKPVGRCYLILIYLLSPSDTFHLERTVNPQCILFLSRMTLSSGDNTALCKGQQQKRTIQVELLASTSNSADHSLTQLQKCF